MTPAGVGQILPGDSKTALISFFNRISFPDLLTNHARSAEGKLSHNHSRPDVYDNQFISGTSRQKQNF
jgi:hypothetical protein